MPAGLDVVEGKRLEGEFFSGRDLFVSGSAPLAGSSRIFFGNSFGLGGIAGQGLQSKVSLFSRTIPLNLLQKKKVITETSQLLLLQWMVVRFFSEAGSCQRD